MADINENTKQNLTDVNTDLNIFIPHDLNDQEKLDLSVKFEKVMYEGSPKPEDVFSVLYKFFDENGFSPFVMEKYADTYWPIFVKIGWQIFPRLQMNYEVEVVVRTLPYAVSNYLDVKTILGELLILYSMEDASLLHSRIKQQILSFDYPISFNEYGKNITISQLAKKINESGVEKDLSRLPMFVEIQKALFPNVPDNYKEAKNDAFKRTVEFLELMSSFVKDANAENLVNSYFDKINKQVGLKMSEEVKAELGARLLSEYFGSGTENTENEMLNDIDSVFNEKPFLTELSKHKTDFVGWITTATTLRSLLLWLGSFSDKVQAHKELAKNLETTLGNESLTNNDLVLAIAHLNEFLTKNGYRGDDFFHFEESDGSFKWGK